MFSSRKNRWFSMLAAAFFSAVAFAAPCLAGDTVEVKNSDKDLPWTLSDLILYRANGEVAVIKKPSDPSDDVEIPPLGTKIFGPVGFEIARCTVSTQIGASELESCVLKVRELVPQPIGFIQELKTGVPLVLAVDQELANFNPQEGDGMTFRNGVYTKGKGVFAGLQPDFENGGFIGLFAGRAKIVDAKAVVTVFPLNGPGDDGR